MCRGPRIASAPGSGAPGSVLARDIGDRCLTTKATRVAGDRRQCGWVRCSAMSKALLVITASFVEHQSPAESGNDQQRSMVGIRSTSSVDHERIGRTWHASVHKCVRSHAPTPPYASSMMVSSCRSPRNLRRPRHARRRPRPARSRPGPLPVVGGGSRLGRPARVTSLGAGSAWRRGPASGVLGRSGAALRAQRSL
jgi:hypothetical protein